MNPFNWNGPAFLLFYLVLATLVTFGLWAWARRGPSDVGVTMSKLANEPYKIACLRRGRGEVTRMAVFNLVDRGLLEFKGPLLSVRKDAASVVTRPIDRAIIDLCAKGDLRLRQVELDSGVKKLADAYYEQLAHEGLVADWSERSARIYLVIMATGLLAAVAFIKVSMATAHGHGNVGFLIVLAIFACIFTIVTGYRATTRAGATLLTDLRTLTARLKANAASLRSGSGTNDALMLASVYGFAALPETFPYVRSHFMPSAGSGGDGGSSSSCSSSCGSSGCGGGGGCGGCGS